MTLTEDEQKLLALSRKLETRGRGGDLLTRAEALLLARPAPRAGRAPPGGETASGGGEVSRARGP